jgi:hypothetical protein
VWYIYIYEDASVKVSQNAPTPGDIVMVGEGLLTVIQCSGKPREVDNTATLVDLPEAKLEGGYNV